MSFRLGNKYNLLIILLLLWWKDRNCCKRIIYSLISIVWEITKENIVCFFYYYKIAWICISLWSRDLAREKILSFHFCDVGNLHDKKLKKVYSLIIYACLKNLSKLFPLSLEIRGIMESSGLFWIIIYIKTTTMN